MLEIEIDGKAVEVAEGSSVIEAAQKLGVYIPHFCYHKKLSIAASCRMCLVEVEKAPKPLPACATPVTNGMKVFTHSNLAVQAQKGVMEFLLINHPMDCPICDQGGECQLQDLAMGYGYDASRFVEEKRVVVNKNLGSLIRTDMTRCIHCTRCVRFLDELGGQMEMGQCNRGDRSEIMPFIEGAVTSEISGNVIDLCPVGALTSKPFRFAARTWELARRKSIAAHDSLGSHLVVQVQHEQVKRVLPGDADDINECWLSDRDRFSYEGLNSAERLTKPMLKHGGQWHEVDWARALDYVAHALRDISNTHGRDALATIAGPQATLEELYLAQKLTRGLGGQIDSRLRTRDFSLDGKRCGIPWLGMRIAEFSQLDRVLVIGSNLRKEQPLLAQRLRVRARAGAQVSWLHAAADDQRLKLHARITARPGELVSALAQIVKSAAEQKALAVPAEVAAVSVTDEARKIAASLISGSQSAIFLGDYAAQHTQAASLHQLAQQLATLTGARFGYSGGAANAVAAYVAGAVVRDAATQANARMLFAQARKAYVLLHTEPELDSLYGAQTLTALQDAATVVVLSPFKSAAAMEYADVLLPVAPFTETSGTYINLEGRVQSFQAVVKPLGDTRPAWKVLRVLGNLTEQPGFDYNSSEEVRREVLAGDVEFVSGLDNQAHGLGVQPGAAAAPFERLTEVPLYAVDGLVRRAPSLQKTPDAAAPVAGLNAATLARLGIAAGAQVRLTQGRGQVSLPAVLDDSLPDDCVRLAAGYTETAALESLTDQIHVERA